MQRALITHFISSGVQEGQLRLWNVSSCPSQMSQMGMQILFEQLYIYMVLGGKKSAYFLSLSGENAHPVVLRP